jgi:hypothetical protein
MGSQDSRLLSFVSIANTESLSGGAHSALYVRPKSKKILPVNSAMRSDFCEADVKSLNLNDMNLLDPKRRARRNDLPGISGGHSSIVKFSLSHRG